MKISIVDQLVEAKTKSNAEIKNDPLKDVKLLLEGKDAEDARILKSLSPNGEVGRIELALGEKIQLEKFDDVYKGKVYTIKQIEKLAIDFHLRFLEAKHYIGKHETSIVREIREFATATGAQIDNYALGNRYFILAPPAMFSLNETKFASNKYTAWQKFVDSWKDPVMFYRIDDNHYRFIKKWGGDFTIFRYLSGFRWKGFYQHWAFNTALLLPIVAIAMAFLFSFQTIVNNPIKISALIVASSAIIAHIRWGWGKLDFDFFETDIIKSFFTPWNWNSKEKIKN